MSQDIRFERLQAASAPRQAKAMDASALGQLFGAAFLHDPVFAWIARPGPERKAVLEQFFSWMMDARAIPFGEVWIAQDAGAAAAWLPPGAPVSPGGLVEQVKLLPLFLKLCGITRLSRGAAMADALEKHHPHEPHFYLAVVGVAPGSQGMGLGSAILDATLKRVDATHLPAYLENSNPKNTRLYERAGFVTRGDIAPKGAPPLLGMWRAAR